ncbi:MAG: carboxymuconolactone decarboxylase family protein [Pseudomonadota bacterium]
MGTPRVPHLTVEEAKDAAAQVGIAEMKAGLSMYRILLRHPQLAKRVNDMMETLSTDSEFDARLRELIIMRLAWMNNGEYEWSLHWLVAPGTGLEERDMRAARNWTEHDHWSDSERVVLRATDEVLASGVISKSTWTECAKHLPSHRDQLDLLAIILNWKMVSDLLKTLEVPLDEGIPSWPPEGLSPETAATQEGALA